MIDNNDIKTRLAFVFAVSAQKLGSRKWKTLTNFALEQGIFPQDRYIEKKGELLRELQHESFTELVNRACTYEDNLFIDITRLNDAVAKFMMLIEDEGGSRSKAAHAAIQLPKLISSIFPKDHPRIDDFVEDITEKLEHCFDPEIRMAMLMGIQTVIPKLSHKSETLYYFADVLCIISKADEGDSTVAIETFNMLIPKFTELFRKKIDAYKDFFSSLSVNSFKDKVREMAFETHETLKTLFPSKNKGSGNPSESGSNSGGDLDGFGRGQSPFTSGIKAAPFENACADLSPEFLLTIHQTSNTAVTSVLSGASRLFL